MKKLYLLLSILFLATSVTFAQSNKNTAQANKKKMAQIQKQREQQKKKTAQMQQKKAKEQQKQAKAKTAPSKQQSSQAKSNKPETKKATTPATAQKKAPAKPSAVKPQPNQKPQTAQKKQPKGRTTKENNTVKDPEIVHPTVVITDENNDTIKVRQRNWFDSWKKDRKLPPIEEKSNELKIYFDPLNGFEFNFVSCVGDPETGKVLFTFSYTYSSRNVQEINMPTGAKAKDINGELYLATHCQGGQKRSSVSKKPDMVVLCMNYVPSSLKEFISVATSFNTSKSGNTVIEFTNIPIKWEKKME